MEIKNFEITKTISLKGFTYLNPKNKQMLFFIHGLASNSSLFIPMASELHKLGYSSVAIDLRGHGKSSKPSYGYTLEIFSKDISTIIKKYFNKKPIIVGQSMGANLGVMLASYSKPIVKGSICIDGGFINLKTKFPDWNECKKQLTPPDFDNISASQLKELIKNHHPDWSELSIQGTLNNWKVFNNLKIRRRLSEKKHLLILKSLWKHNPIKINQVNAPTLLIYSTLQNKIRDFQKARSKIKIIKVNGDHDIHAQKPKMIANIINHHISKGFFNGIRY